MLIAKTLRQSQLFVDKRDKLGRFLEGSIPWNKGKKNIYSKEILEKMSKAKKGKHLSPKTEFKKNHTPWNKGMDGLNLGNGKSRFQKGHRWSKKIQAKINEKIREKIALKPNLEMNKNLGYILGMVYGDGCVFKNNRTYRIVLDTTNKIIAINFSNALREIGLNPSIAERMPSNGIGKLKKYIVIARSVNFG